LGDLGVHFFFGISGYLICSRLLDEMRTTRSISLARFYRGRAFRILPASLAYLAFAVLCGKLGLFPLSAREVTAATLFVRNYVSGNWYTAHFWSLAVEEHFYVFFPLLLSRVGSRRSLLVAVGLAIADGGWRLLDEHYGVLTHRLPHDVSPAGRTDYCLTGLMLGCAAALAVDKAGGKAPRALCSPGLPWIIALGLVASALGVIPRPPDLITSAAIATALVSTAKAPATAVGRLLEARPMRWLGRVSYSVYLWQQVFFVRFREYRVEGLHLVQNRPISMAVLLGVAIFSYYVIERPMIRWGQRRSRHAPTIREAHVMRSSEAT
jgi:peptidoglycan/LPS O-acetylase OafA/YrhL